MTCQFTNAAVFGLRYAAAIKKKYPGTFVITGGNHATCQYGRVPFGALRPILGGNRLPQFSAHPVFGRRAGHLLNRPGDPRNLAVLDQVDNIGDILGQESIFPFRGEEAVRVVP